MHPSIFIFQLRETLPRSWSVSPHKTPKVIPAWKSTCVSYVRSVCVDGTTFLSTTYFICKSVHWFLSKYTFHVACNILEQRWKKDLKYKKYKNTSLSSIPVHSSSSSQDNSNNIWTHASPHCSHDSSEFECMSLQTSSVQSSWSKAVIGIFGKIDPKPNFFDDLLERGQDNTKR